ncbi:MAG: 50S ribosomal protein L23 [Gammaproteobacteria bacterium]|jgi:large subunit ribosomal protein L23|nr:MAG: 50S ribosomal protein L23 [Gammaproteobacteria bacterium TMED159]RCL41731.1 MAG: 50S ribosomal protein L23 [Gammaproteobacteria bacterium]|tara:strand:+ start:1060 stop:1362 length:303 start_codon:yes stop_codon:yes gene_type:complete
MSTIIPNKIIESALISEKASLVGQNANTYVFKVNTSATKNQVKKAIEQKFDVNVIKVNILNVKGKTKRMMNLKGKIRKKSDWKKAYVSLKSEDRIEIAQE